MNLMNAPTIRLTSLAHGGGCGCKLAPSVLRQLLAEQPAVHPYRELLVGTETGDDAAVWQLDDDTCIIATTDFFMPMVDDPFDFGRIAATNAISDIYAMGGRPIMALAILGMPIDKVPPEMVREILKGWIAGLPDGRNSRSRRSLDQFARADLRPRRHRCRPARGHPAQYRCKAGRCADSDKSSRCRHLFGGLQKDGVIIRFIRGDDGFNDFAQPYRNGLRQGPCCSRHYRRDGFWTARARLEMARGSNVSLVVRFDDLPFLTEAERFAQENFVTGASARNWASYAESITLPAGFAEWRRHLLTDPQTSGGLLIACELSRAAEVAQAIADGGYPQARIIGRADPGPPSITISM